MNRIALDLELEQPNTRSDTSDSELSEERIIQVGYVVFDDETGEIYKTVCKEVNIGVDHISAFITKLTGVTTEMVKNGESLESVIDGLHEDRETYNASRKLLTWGGGDQPCIKKELRDDYPWGFGFSSVNVKHLYQLHREAMGKNASGGLKKSMRHVGLTFEGKGHNAAVDAYNTALMFMRLYGMLKWYKHDD